MKHLRQYIRQILLSEDAMGFVHALAAASDEFGEEGEDFYGGDPGKSGGRAIKRAFNTHADHEWLATIDTVHWGDVYGLADLVGRNRDELSASMTLPSDGFIANGDVPGLWVKGRITLAAKDMDKLYSGHYDDYGPGKEGTEEEVAHRDRSSGRNKRPTISKDYSRYSRLKRGNEYSEKMARDIPYVLDQSTWETWERGGNPTEALVDNWRPVGLIADWETIKILKKLKKGREMDPDDYINPEETAGKMKKLLKLAQEFGVPVYDRKRNKLWSPE